MQALNMNCVVLIVFIIGILAPCGVCEGTQKVFSIQVIVSLKVGLKNYNCS